MREKIHHVNKAFSCVGKLLSSFTWVVFVKQKYFMWIFSKVLIYYFVDACQNYHYERLNAVD